MVPLRHRCVLPAALNLFSEIGVILLLFVIGIEFPYAKIKSIGRVAVGVGTLGLLTVTANTTSGNLLTNGIVSAAGNVTGNYILGNGALLTGVITSVANINNGTSNVTVVSSGGNVAIGVGGTSNVVMLILYLLTTALT